MRHGMWEVAATVAIIVVALGFWVFSSVMQASTVQPADGLGSDDVGGDVDSGPPRLQLVSATPTHSEEGRE